MLAMGCVALVSSALLGCQSSKPPAYWQDAPVDYRKRHPIVVDNGPVTLNLNIIPGRRGRVAFGRDQYDSIQGFMARYKERGRGGILALVALPPSAERVRIRKKGCRVIKVRANRDRHYLMGVRSQLIRAGIPSSLLTVQRGMSPDGSVGTVQLRFVEQRARVATRCGLWPTDLAGAAASDGWGRYSVGLYDNEPYWNYGCATQSNWATQIDLPRDIVQMRAVTMSDSIKSLLRYDQYRGGAVQ
jgi:pilus assembly protein CpaD